MICRVEGTCGQQPCSVRRFLFCFLSFLPADAPFNECAIVHCSILHAARSFLRSQPILSQSINSPHFMENKGSLPHSQVPATCPYPEADQSCPCFHPTSWRSILILSSHLRLGLPSGLFLSGFHTNSCTHLSSPPYVLNAPPIPFSSIWSPE